MKKMRVAAAAAADERARSIKLLPRRRCRHPSSALKTFDMITVFLERANFAAIPLLIICSPSPTARLSPTDQQTMMKMTEIARDLRRRAMMVVKTS